MLKNRAAAAAEAKIQESVIAQCMQEFGNKNDGDLLNMLVRSQKNVCSVKTT